MKNLLHDCKAKLTMLPLLILAVMFLILPLVNLVVKSFCVPGENVFTLNNYRDIFTKAIYLATIKNSLKLSFLSTAIGLVLSFITALAVTVIAPKGQSRFMSILNMVSNFAGLPLAFAFIVIMGSSGVVIQITEELGLDFLSNFKLYSEDGLLLLFVYFQIPLGTLLLIPAFQGIRPEWKESAAIMRATPFQFWTRVGVPLLIPSLTGTFGMLFANALTAYATAYVLMTTNYPLLPIKIASMFTGEMAQQEEMGSALSIVMMAILLAVIALCNLCHKKLYYKGGKLG